MISPLQLKRSGRPHRCGACEGEPSRCKGLLSTHGRFRSICGPVPRSSEYQVGYLSGGIGAGRVVCRPGTAWHGYDERSRGTSSGGGAASGQLLGAWSPLGYAITKVSDQAGDATRVKLVRSVYMKGRDALIVELLIAANLIGAERVLVDSISAAPGEQVSFAELVDRVLPALAKHAERRADELNDTGAVLRELGLDPIMVEAAERRLRWMADRTAADTPRSEQFSAIDVVAGLLGRARTDP